METNTIVITIPGVPVPWARPWGGKTTPYFTPPKQRAYKRVVQLVGKSVMRGKKPLQGPLHVKCTLVYPGRSGWKTTKPDCDNGIKGAWDALNKIAWEDDSQICHAEISKFYGPDPKMEIRITPLEQS